jgi:hypothetical protein
MPQRRDECFATFRAVLWYVGIRIAYLWRENSASARVAITSRPFTWRAEHETQYSCSSLRSCQNYIAIWMALFAEISLVRLPCMFVDIFLFNDALSS